MRIENVQWAQRQGYPELRVTLDGHLVSIPDEQKPTLAGLGILFVANLDPRDDWASRLPPVHVPAAEGRTAQDHASCIQDPEVFRLWREMMQAVEADPKAFLEQALDVWDGD